MTSNADTDLDKLISFGQMALEQGWYDQARQYYQQALELDAANLEAMKGLARTDEILRRRAATPVERVQDKLVESTHNEKIATARQCWYCGKPISLLRRLTRGIHPECKKEYEANLKRFEDALMEVSFSDKVIDDPQVLELDALVSSGRVRQEDRREIGLAVYKKLRKQALEDGYFTADEHEQLRWLQSYIDLDGEEAGAKELDRVRLLSAIIEGDLPKITPSINLQKKEVAHLETTTKWCHLKTRRRRIAGTRAKSIRISKDFRFKIPATSGHSKEYTELQTVDEGKAIITSKRLIFVGTKKNLSVKLDKILDLDLYTDAVSVHRGTRNPSIFMLDDPKMFYAVLVGAINAQ